jgi:tRNA(Ile)-lysidine synthase
MLERTFVRAIRENNGIQGNLGLVLAISGGKDSMALLHLASKFRHYLPANTVVATLNHGIRPDTMDDVMLVIRASNGLGFPVIVGYLEPQLYSDENSLRLHRREFLLSVMSEVGADRIWTAHHADDNVETMLLHLSRGAGLNGLVGMKPLEIPWGKPLLGAFREEIDEYVRKNDIPFREDYTNFEDTYQRNRLRRKLIPLWSELSGYDVRKTLFSSQRSLMLYQSFVEEMCENILSEITMEKSSKMLKLSRKAFLGYSRNVQVVLIHHAIESMGGIIPARGQIEDAVNCVRKRTNRCFGSFAISFGKDCFILEVR